MENTNIVTIVKQGNKVAVVVDGKALDLSQTEELVIGIRSGEIVVNSDGVRIVEIGD